MKDSDLLDVALSMLVDFELEMPCDTLPDIDDTCSETCKYSSPQKECWQRYLGHMAEGGIAMWEDQYQVYRRYGDGKYDLRASSMTIDDAVLFVKALFGENFNDSELRLEIRRQPIEPEDDV